MANILGIDYYRAVCETGEKEWSQVYVKTAFDQEEAARFGAVFGVLKLTGKDDLVSRGMALIAEIDKWIEEGSHKADVAGLLDLLNKRRAGGAFVWIYPDDSGSRRMKAGALAGNGVAIFRGGMRVWLFENGDGRVVAGEAKEGDKVFFGDKEAVDLVDQQLVEGEGEEMEGLIEKVGAEMMKMAEGARAALILTVKKMTVTMEEKETEEEKPGSMPAMEEIILSSRKKEEVLVGNKIVGGMGLAGKMAQAKLSWREFVLRGQKARPLPSDEGKQKKRRAFLALGGIFLLVFAVSVALGLVKVRKDAANASFRAVFEPLEKKRQEAEALFNLNPVGARDLMRSVRQEEESKKGQFKGKNFDGKIADFEKKMEETWIKVSGEVKTNFDLFFNLGLIRSQMKGDRLAFTGKDFLVLDIASGVVAKIGYADKKQEVILGKGEGQGWLDVAGLSNNSVLLTKSSLTGILAGAKSEMKFDAAVTEPVAVDVFTGAAYVLDKGASEIWRFGLSAGAVGERRRWLLPGVEADLVGGVDLAIDTDIWVGMGNGKIMRFRRGQFEKFKLSDAPENFRIKRLAVNGDVKQIAVLDSEKGRVVLFDKATGAYIKQLIAPEMTQANDLVWVDEHNLMVLVGEKLYLTSI